MVKELSSRLNSGMQQAVGRHLGPESRKWLRRVRDLGARLVYGGDLNRLATYFETDKWGVHEYTPHYARHFGLLRMSRLKVLEIGIGGYDRPRDGGNSLRMWKAYFPLSRICGLDLYDKSYHEEPRIRIYQGSQTDAELLERIHVEEGPFDLIIDDGSHVNEHVRATFEYLFPRLAPGGIYAIEDTQTSYWPDYGGSNRDLNRLDTTMGFLKSLTDGLNREDQGRTDEPTYFDRHVASMHFYHNLVFVYKTP